MRNKFHATLLITAVGAALTFAGPAAAQRGHGGGNGGGVHAGGGVRAGGGPARIGAPARIGGGGAMHNRGAARVNPRGPAYSGARVAGRNFNRGDFRHDRGFHLRPGFAAGVAAGAFAAYPWGYDPYYDYGYGSYDDGYIGGFETYAADADVQYCTQRFRSYDIATRTYLGFDGLRHPCP